MNQTYPTPILIVLTLAALFPIIFLSTPVFADDAARARNLDLLQPTIDAHGGVERWAGYTSFTYRMVGFPLTPAVAEPSLSRVDLRTRSNRIESDGYTVGWNGNEAWVTPNPESVGLPPRFYTLGSFYFIGMPFVFADPGVVLADYGESTFRGVTYRVLKAEYVDGVGHSAEDDYLLYIDPQTNRLALIDHSVTETGIERVTWTFDEWQTVGGLLVPAQMTFFPGAPADQKPREGATFSIEQAIFGRQPLDATIYDPPGDAVITSRR